MLLLPRAGAHNLPRANSLDAALAVSGNTTSYYILLSIEKVSTGQGYYAYSGYFSNRKREKSLFHLHANDIFRTFW